MAACGIISGKAGNACSEKCMSNTCDKVPCVWVVAACEGMISLFERTPDGHMVLIPQDEGSVFTSMEAFQSTLTRASAMHQLDRLIIVGGRSDIAWMHAALPSMLAKHVAAEIEYPLIAGWFRQPAPLQQLAQALGQVFIS